MGTVLEIAKIVTVLWLHRNWKQSAKILKFYFCSAVLILMGITSLGIFGYLSFLIFMILSLSPKALDSEWPKIM